MVIGNTEIGGIVNELTSRHGADVCHLAMMRQVCIGAVRNLGAKTGVDFSSVIYMLHSCVASHMLITGTDAAAVDRVSADAGHAFAIASIMGELPQ
ncbi:hypothetical protein EJO68_04200 [Variovorax atrisoli]|uniref:hypothetical protein n=1 Tax=Variovorax atrisoli TaxID=3394203 RepID=UPI000F7D831E|nr:hypothetical protein [Variovorax sp. 369]RTD98581.1 hypothetical protein EJO68_04200 [Variovorax sp. 369]